MNFKQFLKTEKTLNESFVAEATNPVVVGYGTFDPCHIGYLPLAAELVKLSEQHDADPVLIVVERASDVYQKMLPTITKCLARHFPTITIRVEQDVAAPMCEFAQTGRMPVAVVGEDYLVQEAKIFHEKLHNAPLMSQSIDLSHYKRTSMVAVQENNFDNFRASILDCSFEEALGMFSHLREVANG